jgi:hypothetical protein
MNIMLSAAVVAIVLAGSSGSTQTSAPKLLTIATILAHPSAYDANLVRIKGAAVVRFEAVYICDKPEMIDSGQSKKCLWLGATEIDRDAINNLHRKLVDMVGRFHAGDHGHMSAYGGTISPIAAKILGVHGHGDIPPPPPSSGN